MPEAIPAARYARDFSRCYVDEGHAPRGCICPICKGEQLCPCDATKCRQRRGGQEGPSSASARLPE